MDPAFWRKRWQNKEIGFHQSAYHDLLQEHWPRLGLERGSSVFVPLCGKSLDMVWLAKQGHSVVGSELSEVAINEFFAERGLEPTHETIGRFEVKSADAFTFWCGDFFELPRDAVTGVAGVYDRAALIAFPPSMQERYADALKALSPKPAPILLITLDYDQAQMAGPPFAVTGGQVRRLFADRYEISQIACRDALAKNARFKQRGLTALEEHVYLLQRAS